jgi:hypothetical protein
LWIGAVPDRRHAVNLDAIGSNKNLLHAEEKSRSPAVALQCCRALASEAKKANETLFFACVEEGISGKKAWSDWKL